MNNKLLVFTLIISFFSLRTLASDDYKRHVSFEWDAVEKAHLYEIELTPVIKGGHTYFFKTKTPRWSGLLKLGHYKMRARTLDDRGVPGEWSDSGPFDVLLEKTKIKAPLPQAKIEENNLALNETEIHFEWQPVNGAFQYHFELHDDRGDFKIDETLTSTELTRKLPVAAKFTWKVSAIGSDKLPSEPNSESEFSIQGPKLAKPKFKTPRNRFVRELSWENPEKAEAMSLTLKRWDSANKIWQDIFSSEKLKEEVLSFDPKWKGGKYQVSLLASAQLRASSDPTVAEFYVFNGDRSFKSETNHRIQEFNNLRSPWIGLASYLISQVNYASLNYDHMIPAQTSYNALSSTASLGASYLKDQQAWGFSGLIDFARLSTNQGAVNTVAAESSAVWRKELTHSSQIRIQSGAFFKEYLVAETDDAAKIVGSYSYASVVGPLLQIEYRYSFTSLFGMRLWARLTENLLKMSLSNGKDMESTFATRYGLMTSYRISPRVTTLLGITLSGEQLRYQSMTNDSKYLGQENEIKTNEASLKFSMEYNF